MRAIEYVRLEELDPEDLGVLMNKQRVREHLIDHALFDASGIETWIQDKRKVDRADGCRVRGIVSGNEVAGWCGIQLEQGKYEIAIVLDDRFWGIGRAVFNDLLGWSKELGHKEVFIHFLHTRPEYRFLRKISTEVFETEMSGDKFTTYRIPVR